MGHPSWDGSRANSLNFGVPREPEASELPKGLVLSRDENIHIRLIGSTPLGDVGSYTTHHITADLDNLTLVAPFEGNERITAGNGRRTSCCQHWFWFHYHSF